MEPIRVAREGPGPALHRVITLRHAVAIYVSSLLGSGIFVIPGLAARIAGPASIVSWMLLSLASYPFAYTFAKLSARKPESGGIYAFARDGIGVGAGAATAWLFLAWAVLGAPAATVAAASYTPFLPNGIASIGTAAALIVWSYLGYENTSNVAEEFRNPERDFHRSVVISVLLISGLYLAVAIVTVGTGAYTVGGGVTPFAAMMSGAFG